MVQYQKHILTREVGKTKKIRQLLPRLLVLLVLACLMALPVHAADYDTVLDKLERLQTLAEAYAAESAEELDPVHLTLSYTRVGEYNAAIWQLTAGARDPLFEQYVAAHDPEVGELQGVGTVTLPNGQNIDFGHLLAATELVYTGIPITGSWGGDCMQLAAAYRGQASDVEGYKALMSETFNIPGGGAASVFGDEDLLADMDAVVLGSRIVEGVHLATQMREYYSYIDNYERAYNFIGLSFGTIDTGKQSEFRQEVYNTLVGDTGMQLLLYINGMWQQDGWQMAPDAQPALQAASELLADCVSGLVNGETIYMDVEVRMVTLAPEALIDALNTLGENDAAMAAQGALTSSEDPTAGGSRVDAAAAQLRSGFNAGLFRAILLVVAGASLVGMTVFLVLFAVERERRPHSHPRPTQYGDY